MFHAELLQLRASANDNPDAPPTNMTKEEARAILGVSATTRFDEILAAKNELKRNANNTEAREQVKHDDVHK